MDSLEEVQKIRALGWQWDVAHAEAFIETGGTLFSLGSWREMVPQTPEVPWPWLASILPCRHSTSVEEVQLAYGVACLAIHPTLPLRWDWTIAWGLADLARLTMLRDMVVAQVPLALRYTARGVFAEIAAGYAATASWWQARATALQVPLSSNWWLARATALQASAVAMQLLPEQRGEGEL